MLRLNPSSTVFIANKFFLVDEIPGSVRIGEGKRKHSPDGGRR
jgi:hypothetical protein